MDEYLDRQRRRFLKESQTPQQSAAAAARPCLSRVHILPVNGEVRERATVWMSRLQTEMDRGRTLAEGDLLFEDTAVVAKTDPAFVEGGGVLTADTEIYLDGPPVTVCTRVQLVLLGASAASDEESEVFEQVLGPFLQRRLQGSRVMLVSAGGVLEVVQEGERRSFNVAAVDPPVRGTGVVGIDRNTLVYLTIDRAEEYARIHVVPYQETLPRAYEFDVFMDYLRPYFQSHQFQQFGLNQHFVFNGVQFRIVAVEPADGTTRRVGRRTVIYCEGMLHGNMRNVLPAEVMEQLALLPPGLQLLLLNSDASAGIEQTLNTRRGLDEATIARLPEIPWSLSETRQESCMVCLAEYREGEIVRQLPCNHVYHAPCIDEWLRRNTDCPLCKANVDRLLRGY